MNSSLKTLIFLIDYSDNRRFCVSPYLDIDHLRSLAIPPYYFGLGFIQLKLNQR